MYHTQRTHIGGQPFFTEVSVTSFRIFLLDFTTFVPFLRVDIAVLVSQPQNGGWGKLAQTLVLAGFLSVSGTYFLFLIFRLSCPVLIKSLFLPVS